MHSPREREVERHRPLSVSVSPPFLYCSAAYGCKSSVCVFENGRECFEDGNTRCMDICQFPSFILFDQRSQQRLMNEGIRSIIIRNSYYLIRGINRSGSIRAKMNISIIWKILTDHETAFSVNTAVTYIFKFISLNSKSSLLLSLVDRPIDTCSGKKQVTWRYRCHLQQIGH